MTLEQQLSSLDPSRRLKELGVKQESYFNWVRWKDEWQIRILTKEDSERIKKLLNIRSNKDMPEEFVSAFTVAELGEMLPENAMSFRHDKGGIWTCRMHEYTTGVVIYDTHDEYGKTEADARAKMLIYLITNKLLKV